MGCHPEMERDAQIKTCYFPLLSFKSKQTCIFKDSPFIVLPRSGQKQLCLSVLAPESQVMKHA